MKRFFASSLKAVFTVALAVTLLLTTTACSQARDLQAKALGNKGPNVPGQEQPYEGGMNNFSDVNPNRIDTTSAEAKAKALKDKVERRIDEKSVDSVDQYVENYRSGTPLGERTKRLGKDLTRGANEAKDDAQDVLERSSKRLEKGAKDAPQAAGRALDQAKANTKDAGSNAGNDIQEIGDKLSKVGQRAADYASDKADDAKRAIDRAS